MDSGIPGSPGIPDHVAKAETFLPFRRRKGRDMAFTRFHAEIGTATAMASVGALAVSGAIGLGYSWREEGPEAGYFPFYVGLILIGASLWNLYRAFAHRHAAATGAEASGNAEAPFLQPDQLRRIGTFVAAMTVFVVATLTLGVYLAAFGYIAWSAWRQGGYRPVTAFSIGAAFSIVQYVIFEMIFRIPLLKGPVESLLGIY